MKMTKGKAFALCLASVMFIFISMFILGAARNDAGIIPVAACLTAIGSLACVYIAGDITNNRIKAGKWCQEMYDSENPKIITGGENCH